MITIELVIVAKVIIYLGISFPVAVMCLFPINDRPTSPVQWVVFGLIEVLIGLVMFTNILSRFQLI